MDVDLDDPNFFVLTGTGKKEELGFASIGSDQLTAWVTQENFDPKNKSPIKAAVNISFDNLIKFSDWLNARRAWLEEAARKQKQLEDSQRNEASMTDRITQYTTKFHNFYLPENKDLEPGVVYVSKKFSSSVHLCFCGCGQTVVLPFIVDGEDKNHWRLTVEADGTVSFAPSVGNQHWPCKSHYFLTKGEVKWI